MRWRPEPNDRFYRFTVRTGLVLRWLFRIRVLITGREHLPQPGPLSASRGAAARGVAARGVAARGAASRGAAASGPSRPVVPGGGAVVAITHFGYLDFAFAEMLLWWHNRAQLRFLVTQGAADHWLAGPAVSAAGHVVVGYGSGAHAYDAAVARLREGEYIGVLPEAGVSRSFTVRECKTGAVRMAAEARVPIIPVSIWGAHRLMTRHHAFSPRRAWRAPVRIHVGAPILPGSLPGPAEDARQATARLATTLQEGIDTGIADFPLQPAPGAWWMPAGLGGSAATEEERRRLDKADGPRRAGARRR
ncbi:lysophospholipid acyltransferase family protein [Arthrobacter sp. ES3-54]|uniref:lysophospholipid acyltransferase family protein n=1 Tax=Arthrobacter sp. ES3-54 TaxID=1502991 RepID=UPI0024070E89|nr:lysophospholipid acyltransferase family protein [Arthrobacter sp. ES3-54]MDF9750891.1 1-acyl-sn-glycerol-3-phosphate acyltransferase [Arthrobacter sp. ES3-54]